jgi:alanine dehydrogenase
MCKPSEGGKGKLVGGIPSTERGRVVVFGAGKTGGASAALAAAAGANVAVFECARTAWTK